MVSMDHHAHEEITEARHFVSKLPDSELRGNTEAIKASSDRDQDDQASEAVSGVSR
jgi:hypothetical protein